MTIPNAILQARVDAAFSCSYNGIAVWQSQFFAEHGRYWQGQFTHSTAPRDPDAVLTIYDLVPDVGGQKPSYELQPWTRWTDPSQFSWPFRLAVNQYVSPRGVGFDVVGQLTLAGVCWTRTAQVGPETFRDTSGDWTAASA